jgi:signal transduction histidine kinase
VILVRRIPWQLPTAVVLLVLLAVLATIQYRWLGEVSQAERERMHTGLRTRATEFAQEFDAELTRTYLAFQVDGDRLDADPEGTLGAAYTRWQSGTLAPDVVKGVYVAEGRALDSATLRRFDPVRGTLMPAAWPAELAVMKRRPSPPPPTFPGAPPPPLLIADAIDATVPALLVPTPHMTRTTTGDQTAIFAQPALGGRAVIVVFDRERLRQQFIEPLTAKYFGVAPGSEYVVTIASRAEPSTIIYTSGVPPVDPGAGDVTTGIFDVRMDALYKLFPGRGTGQPAPADRLSITIFRRSPPPDGKRLLTGAADQGAWEVRARHRSGSLEAIVARSHRRNIAISLGVLGLLAASLVLALGAARRQQRLAQQQMEFVAAVSHELRTPLAVICSAGENLADGVVADSAQVKRYGALIQTEGRRLGDMVERVMEFAGISSGTLRVRSAVDMSRVIAEATDALRVEARDRAVTLDVESNGALPPVTGDVDALRSAVQNIIGNALKYSPLGATVYVSARVPGGGDPRVQIRVADRGLGIDAADLPHIFKPFYRGRRAVDAQVRGAGVGLSVVRHVIDAHGGSVAVDSRVGEGTTVILELPTVAAQVPAGAR